MGVPDGSRGQTALDQLLVRRLDIERADRRQVSGAERGPHISAQQALVAAVAFLPQTRFRSGLKPPIEIIVERDLGAFYVAAEIMLAQHLIKVGLGVADGAADNPAVVAAFAGFAVATEEDAHQPAVPAATHDLSGFPGQTHILPKNLAHHWHTGAGDDRFNSTTWGEGGLRDNQSAPTHNIRISRSKWPPVSILDSVGYGHIRLALPGECTLGSGRRNIRGDSGRRVRFPPVRQSST